VNKEAFVVNALGQDNFLIVNKHVLRYLEGNCSAAILFSELILKHQFYSSSGQLDYDGFFYYTLPTAQSTLGIKRGVQDTALLLLIKKNLIEIENRGYPKKRHFKILYDTMFEILGQKAKEKAKTKEEFFERMNTAKTFAEFERATDNIIYSLKVCMWLLRTVSKIEFESQSFGIFKKYMNLRFRGKTWDYSVVLRSGHNQMTTNVHEVIGSLKEVESNHYSVILSSNESIVQDLRRS